MGGVNAYVEVEHGSLTNYLGTANPRIMLPQQARQTFTAGDSSIIKCSQSVYDLYGHKASSGIDIERGYLEYYDGSAVSSPLSKYAPYLGAFQSFNEASGKLIATEEKASVLAVTAETTTKIQKGKISDFSDRGTAFFLLPYNPDHRPELD